MSFPQTRLTLIQRLVTDGDEEDWQRFLKDYWGPICRFALRWGAGTLHDAEEVASQTFEVIWRNQLLERWVSNRSAKLRSLLCAVVRNVLSNRHRVRANRQRLSADVVRHIENSSRTNHEEYDAFYAAWVEDVLQQSVESLSAVYYAEGKGDYVRVLYGRLCQGLTIAAVAQALDITPASVDHYYRHARKRLSMNLESAVRRLVERYCPAADLEDEFTSEWTALGRYLAENGGLDEAVGQAYALMDPVKMKPHQQERLSQAVIRLSSLPGKPDRAKPSDKGS